MLDFPNDPRSVPGLKMDDLMPMEMAAHKPGKWLRSSSKDLKPPPACPCTKQCAQPTDAAPGHNPLAAMAQTYLWQSRPSSRCLESTSNSIPPRRGRIKIQSQHQQRLQRQKPSRHLRCHCCLLQTEGVFVIVILAGVVVGWWMVLSCFF